MSRGTKFSKNEYMSLARSKKGMSKVPRAKALPDSTLTLIKQGVKASMPQHLKPMLCEKKEQPFDGENWIYELKFDGYRILSFLNKGKIILYSREQQNYTNRYPIVVETFTALKFDAIIDGEMVALNQEGKPDFSEIQNYNGNVPLIYYVFDLLWLNGYDIKALPLVERKKILSELIPRNDVVKYVDHIEERGKEFFEVVKSQDLEGIIAKEKDSIYIPDTRSKSWFKIPVQLMKEYVIVGYTESEAGRPFRRLMFGEYRDGKLFYVHHSSGGISDKLLYSTFQRLKPLEIKTKPVVNQVEEDTPSHWVKPVLVGQFKEKKLAKTRGGSKRHPVIFLGLREDKKAEDVIYQDEEHESIESISEKKAVTKQKKSRSKFDQVEVWKSIHPDEEIVRTDTIEVDQKEIIIINPEREYWQGSVRKIDVLWYYRTISDIILPYLKDRPLGLNVITEKWAGDPKNVFIRNMKGYYPPWVKIFNTKRRVQKRGKSEDIDWVLCNDLASLLYLVNLGTLDFHPWSARGQNFHYPDYLVIDLDPPDRDKEESNYTPKEFNFIKRQDLQKLITTATATQEFVSKHKLVSFVKTSGKKGFHVCLPCKNISYEDAKTVCENIAVEINNLAPKASTLETAKEHRKGLIYIDPGQNDYSDRVAVVYSIRAYKVPTVSAPVEWNEINQYFDRKRFKIDTMQERINEKHDLFRGLLDENNATHNSKILKKFK